MRKIIMDLGNEYWGRQPTVVLLVLVPVLDMVPVIDEDQKM